MFTQDGCRSDDLDHNLESQNAHQIIINNRTETPKKPSSYGSTAWATIVRNMLWIRRMDGSAPKAVPIDIVGFAVESQGLANPCLIPLLPQIYRPNILPLPRVEQSRRREF